MASQCASNVRVLLLQCSNNLLENNYLKNKVGKIIAVNNKCELHTCLDNNSYFPMARIIFMDNNYDIPNMLQYRR